MPGTWQRAVGGRERPARPGGGKRHGRPRRGRLPAAGTESRSLGDEHGLAGDARRQWQIVLGRFVRQPRAMTSLVHLPRPRHRRRSSPATPGTTATPDLTNQIATFTSGGPTWQHPFGVDPIGHDVFAQVMQGTKEDIQTALLVAAITTVIGTTIGALAGYFRGWVDPILMRFTDFVLAVPLLAILAVLANLASKQSGSWFVDRDHHRRARVDLRGPARPRRLPVAARA